MEQEFLIVVSFAERDEPVTTDVLHSVLISDESVSPSQGDEPIAVKYELVKDLFLNVESDTRIQRSNVFGLRDGKKIIASTTTYESGGLRVGGSRTVRFGAYGGINLDIANVRNYGPYIAPERKQYWEADAEITLKF